MNQYGMSHSSISSTMTAENTCIVILQHHQSPKHSLHKSLSAQPPNLGSPIISDLEARGDGEEEGCGGGRERKPSSCSPSSQLLSQYLFQLQSRSTLIPPSYPVVSSSPLIYLHLWSVSLRCSLSEDYDLKKKCYKLLMI